MEKASQGDGNYAAIRDLGRFSLIVEEIELVPGVVHALVECNDFAVSRIKNRLEPGLEAGYRDVQILVREPKGGFIIEIQVIPKQMYTLKQTDGYTKYRFILEACRRANARTTHSRRPSDEAQQLARRVSDFTGDREEKWRRQLAVHADQPPVPKLRRTYSSPFPVEHPARAHQHAGAVAKTGAANGPGAGGNLDAAAGGSGGLHPATQALQFSAGSAPATAAAFNASRSASAPADVLLVDCVPVSVDESARVLARAMSAWSVGDGPGADGTPAADAGVGAGQNHSSAQHTPHDVAASRGSTHTSHGWAKPPDGASTRMPDGPPDPLCGNSTTPGAGQLGGHGSGDAASQQRAVSVAGVAGAQRFVLVANDSPPVKAGVVAMDRGGAPRRDPTGLVHICQLTSL